MNRKPGDWNCSSCDHLNFSWRDSCQRCSEPKPGDGYGRRGDDRGDYGRGGGGGRSYGFGSGYNSGGGGSSGSYYGRSQGGGGDYRGNYGSDYRGNYGSDYRGNYGVGDYNNRSYGGSSGYGGFDVRPGDWHCQESSCGAHNFASRSSCFKCGVAKDEGGANGRGGSYDSARGGGYDSGGRGSRGDFGSSYDSGNAGGGGRAGWKSGDWICGRSGCNEHNFASRMECFRCQAPRET